jgi:TRAP-type C4-dicarboxylate transport system substrate-binding protein
MTQKIKWLLFHEPAELFIRTARHFEQELNALTDGAYEFEILELADYETKYLNGNPCDPITELKEGRVQMSQIYINNLARANVTNFLALGLPFLFRDHAHAARVFEGEIGAELLENIKERIGIKGLSFTYSGGYKCMAVNRSIKQVSDFAGLKYKVRPNAVSSSIFDALGATPAEKSEIDIADTTLPRYHADAREDQTYAINTGHAMYLTTILTNNEMFNAMSEEHQAAFVKAAKIAASAERTQSVKDANEIATTPTLQRERGINEFITWNESQLEELRARLIPVLNSWKAYFPNDLVNRIQAC